MCEVKVVWCVIHIRVHLYVKLISYRYPETHYSSYLPVQLFCTIPAFVMSRVPLLTVVLIAVVVSSASALSCFFRTCSYLYRRNGDSRHMYCVQKHGSRPYSSYKIANQGVDDPTTSDGTIRRDGSTGSNNQCPSRRNSEGNKFDRTLQTNWDFSTTSV